MDYLECHVGNEDIFLPAGDELRDAMMKTNDKVIFLKHIAKKRKVYYGKISDEFILLSPTYIFALEDLLTEIGYMNILHNTLLEFPLMQRYILYVLLREGKSFRFLSHNKKIPFEESLSTIRSLFEKISIKMKQKETGA